MACVNIHNLQPLTKPSLKSTGEVHPNANEL
nr:MAG TPA: hypothetical protein [Caudoviricetes sp.]